MQWKGSYWHFAKQQSKVSGGFVSADGGQDEGTPNAGSSPVEVGIVC